LIRYFEFDVIHGAYIAEIAIYDFASLHLTYYTD